MPQLSPDQPIRALETRYAGCRFRSRLEARWAVFFDQLGIKWEYEPEGYATSAGNYLPDFRICTLDDWSWFEVKPPSFYRDPRHVALAVESRIPVVVARGLPRDYDEQMRGALSPLSVIIDAEERYPCAFVGRHWNPSAYGDTWDLLKQGRLWIADQYCDPHLALYCRPHEQLAGHFGGYPPFMCDDIDAAYTAARSERFGR